MRTNSATPSFGSISPTLRISSDVMPSGILTRITGGGAAMNWNCCDSSSFRPSKASTTITLAVSGGFQKAKISQIAARSSNETTAIGPADRLETCTTAGKLPAGAVAGGATTGGGPPCQCSVLLLSVKRWNAGARTPNAISSKSTSCQTTAGLPGGTQHGQPGNVVDATSSPSGLDELNVYALSALISRRRVSVRPARITSTSHSKRTADVKVVFTSSGEWMCVDSGVIRSIQTPAPAPNRLRRRIPISTSSYRTSTSPDVCVPTPAGVPGTMV